MQSPAAGTKQLHAIAWANWIEISFVGKDSWILVSNMPLQQIWPIILTSISMSVGRKLREVILCLYSAHHDKVAMEQVTP